MDLLPYNPSQITVKLLLLLLPIYFFVPMFYLTTLIAAAND